MKSSVILILVVVAIIVLVLNLLEIYQNKTLVFISYAIITIALIIKIINNKLI